MIRINADDFGYSESDNLSIIFCFQNKVVNSSTIMVNAPMFFEAVEISKNAGVDRFIGLHLNITEFTPLTEEIKSNPKFVKNGAFYNNIRHRGLSSFFSFSRKDKAQIKKEIEAQMKLFRKYFPESDVLDSHHHIHTVYPILKIVLKLAKQYNFKVLRISRNVPKSTLFKTVYKNIINKKIKKEFSNSSVLFLDTSLDSFNYLSQLKTKDKNMEIMVHPSVKGCECVDKLTGFNLLGLEKVIKEWF